MYHFFGFCPESINIINCLLGSLIPILIYYFSKNIFNLKAAKLSALLTMFFPSLFCLSLIAFKDIPLIFLFILYIFSLSRWCTQRKIIFFFFNIFFIKLLFFFS